MAAVLKTLFLLIVAVVGDDDYSRAAVESCGGCKLNRLSEVKKFVMDESVGALSFSRVTRKIIGGHNPDLVFYAQDGSEAERVDMSPFSFEELIELMLSRGFVQNAEL